MQKFVSAVISQGGVAGDAEEKVAYIAKQKADNPAIMSDEEVK